MEEIVVVVAVVLVVAVVVGVVVVEVEVIVIVVVVPEADAEVPVVALKILLLLPPLRGGVGLSSAAATFLNQAGAHLLDREGGLEQGAADQLCRRPENRTNARP